ncbi:MAG: ATP-binding cassette domain-containing protein [Dysgonamonadaceae bacterium]|jgi:ABC-2 type transport system ATP-binding protein|nr:ATP-binding cassette domain-containing protein [Dysgonamonadaceae bacterium]
MYYLQTKDIVKQYAAHRALDGVSIDVPKASVFGLLGPNGAGKTTLIRIITRITAPDSGCVILDGRTMDKNDVYKIGYLPEERGLYKKMKVGEHALFFARLRGMDRAQAQAEIDKWFQKFEMTDWYGKKVEELSKGMQQKVQFIATVIHNPDLLIFDEPFSGFDPVNSELLKTEILKLKAEGKTIILSTHNMESVESICDNITLINRSKAVLQGSVAEIRNSHKSGIFRLKLQADTFIPPADAPFVLLSSAPFGDGLDVRIRKNVDISPAELIRCVLQTTEILSFEEEMPSMNDIFIETVKTPLPV